MGKRRSYTPEFKAATVLAVLSGAKAATEICREHRVKEAVLSRWKQKFLVDAAQVFSEDSQPSLQGRSQEASGGVVAMAEFRHNLKRITPDFIASIVKVHTFNR